MQQIKSAWARIAQLLRAEVAELAHVNRSDRPWEMPIAAALASGIPIFVGAWYGEPGLGLAGALGGQVFLYLPATRLSHRMAWLMACAFGMSGSYALGVVTHLHPSLALPVVVVITIVVTMICRYYAAPPPGSFFFIMAAAIGAYGPAHGREALAHVGAFTLGCVLAVAIAFLYSLHIVSRRGVPAPSPKREPDFDFVVLDSVLIGGFVGLSLLIAHLLQLERPYWVPLSCLAVIQGASLRAVWVRQLHRIGGTALGLLVFLAIAQLPLDPWGVACLLTALTFIIETLVVRHYGLATVFITPLTILLAEAAHFGAAVPQAIMQARLVDTVIGALVGLAGGICLHSPRFRAVVGAGLRRLLPGGTES
jgi:uncharacterized membrane protein YccC